MTEQAQNPRPNLLIRPPYSWWEAPPSYTPAHSHGTSNAALTAPPSLPPSSTIDFLHPAYDYPANILFSLPTLDIPVGSSRPGVHHGTALSACMIIAANRPGRLTTSATTPSVCENTSPHLAWDSVLTHSRYYFHPEGENDPLAPPYPVVPDFRSWQFPHSQLPESWVDREYQRPPSASSAYMSLKILGRDGFCRVTGSTAGLHCSHVIPRAELDWFLANTMSVYNANTVLSPSHAIDDVSNGFALRSDLNGPCIDAGKMVIAPKEGKLVLHFLFDTDELGYLYHNRQLFPIDTIPREFLYARFAWSIFPLLGRFLNTEKNVVIARNVKSVWTHREEYTHWANMKKVEKGEKRKRGAGGRENSGGAIPPGVVQQMEYTRGAEAKDNGFGQWKNSEHSAESWGLLSQCEPTGSDFQDGALDITGILTEYSVGGSHIEPSALAPENEDGSPADFYTEDKIFSPLQKYLTTTGETRALIRGELAEDIRIARDIFPEILEGGDGALMHRDIAFYPGHRQMARLKERLRRDRGWVQSLAECNDSNTRSGKKRRVDG